MTDEAKEIFDEENPAAFEQTDAPPQDVEMSNHTVQDLTDTEAEPCEETAASIDEEQEPVPDGEESAHEDQASFDETDAIVEESRIAEQVADALPGEEQEPVQEASENELPDEIADQSSDVGPQSPAESPEPTTDNQPLTTEEQTPTVESVIEAILFATDEPLTDGKLASIVETTAKQVRESVESLNAKYAAHNNAFRIEQIAGGYQMLTLNIYNSWLKKMLHARSDSRLSPAAMETLAIIAYKQPIIRADIEAIRGVAVGEVIRSLMYKGLVKIVGRAEILGRPMLYGTTKKFLEVFGLNSLKDLPKAEELKNPDQR